MSLRNERRRRQVTWIGILISVVCLAFVLRGVDLHHIASTLSKADPWDVLLLLAVNVLFYWVKAVRWRMLLGDAHPCTSTELVGPTMIGTMANNLLPAHLGELVRMDFCSRLLGFPRSAVLASLVLERMFDVVAVTVLFAVGVLTVGDMPDSFVSAGYVIAALAAVGLALALAYVVRTSDVLRLVAASTRFLHERIQRDLLEQLELGATGMTVLRNPRAWVSLVSSSFLQWGLMALCIQLSLGAVGVEVPQAASLVILGATVVGVTVPAAPGFFGTLELAFVISLRPFAVDESGALAAAVFFHVIPFIAATLAGWYFLSRAGVRLRDVAGETRE